MRNDLRFRHFPVIAWDTTLADCLWKLSRYEHGDGVLPVVQVKCLHPELVPKPSSGKQKPDALPIALDLKDAAPDGRSALPQLAKLTGHPLACGVVAWPVIHADDLLHCPDSLALFHQHAVVCLRIDVDATTSSAATWAVNALRNAVGRKTDLYVLLDISRVAEPDEELTDTLAHYVRRLISTEATDSIAVIGNPSAAPEAPQRLQKRRCTHGVGRQVMALPGCESIAVSEFLG